MPNPIHASEKDLIRFADEETHGKAAARIEIHLQECMRCRLRLEELRSAANAYSEYHNRVLKPALESSHEWRPLHVPIASLNRRQSKFRFSPALGALSALACGLAVLAFFYYRDTPHRSVTQLLAHAAAVRTPAHGRVRVTWNGRSWYRPAMLQRQGHPAMGGVGDSGPEHTRALFVQANYSWDDPLSARSFAAWRDRLQDKRDQVVSVRGENGASRFYRLRTQTSEGVLRIASLTLRADSFRPVEGQFHFEDREDVTMAESGEMPSARPVIAAIKPAAPAGADTESKVSPQDELRVFAALNAIGADAGEPLTVNVDSSRQHVVVSGVGISGNREREIRQALAQISNARTHFDSGQPSPAGKAIHAPDSSSTGTSAPLRSLLESRSGGPQPFQEITDRALDLSSSLVAQAHALDVLAQTFSPALELRFGAADREILRSLQHRHALAIEQAASQLRENLAPLVNSPANQLGGASGETRNRPEASWQAGAAELLVACKELDTSLSRLLGGSYSQQTGADILRRLPDELQSVEKLALLQQTAP